MMPEVIAGGFIEAQICIGTCSLVRLAWSSDRGGRRPRRRRNIEVGFANQKRPEFGLAESAEELREPALRHIEFERFLVLPMHLHPDILLGILGHRGVHGSPSAARAAVDAFRREPPEADRSRRSGAAPPLLIVSSGALPGALPFTRPGGPLGVES